MKTERRSFLKGLVAAAVAAAVAPHALPKMLETIPGASPAEVATAPLMKMRAFIPVSIELLEDYPNLNHEIQRLLADAAEEQRVKVLSPLRRLTDDEVPVGLLGRNEAFFAAELG